MNSQDLVVLVSARDIKKTVHFSDGARLQRIDTTITMLRNLSPP